MNTLSDKEGEAIDHPSLYGKEHPQAFADIGPDTNEEATIMIDASGARLTKDESEEIDRKMKEDPAYQKRIAEREEKKRMDAIILNMTRIGQYVLNERPEGMSFEDFKYVRRELNRVRNNHLAAGTIVHSSSPKLKGGPGNSFKKENEEPDKNPTQK